jgi:hypothetical protein
MVFPYCHACKGVKDLCGLGRCPLLDDIRKRLAPVDLTGKTVEGPSPPSVFVGSYGYPRISVGPLASSLPVPRPERLESPTFLYSRALEDVYSIRASLIRGRYALNVRTAADRNMPSSEPLWEIEKGLPFKGRKVLSSVQELALSSRSLDTVMELSKVDRAIRAPPSLDTITMPMGPSVKIDDISVQDGAKVPNAVERASSDTDLPASEATIGLYDSGIPQEHLTRLFSVGLLGEARRRRLVPTRWTITAVDDTLSMALKERVLELPPLDRFLLYSGSHYGNNFLIAYYPPPFRFEMMEQWQRGSLWGGGKTITDHEGPRGRKDYASNITGGYYAARLPVVEHMMEKGFCAGATVIRWITDEYWAPLGVWVVRETVRSSLVGPPMEFSDLRSLFEELDRSSGVSDWKVHTRFLRGNMDTTLTDFI